MKTTTQTVYELRELREMDQIAYEKALVAIRERILEDMPDWDYPIVTHAFEVLQAFGFAPSYPTQGARFYPISYDLDTGAVYRIEGTLYVNDKFDEELIDLGYGLSTPHMPELINVYKRLVERAKAQACALSCSSPNDATNSIDEPLELFTIQHHYAQCDRVFAHPDLADDAQSFVAVYKRFVIYLLRAEYAYITDEDYVSEYTIANGIWFTASGRIVED